MFANISMIYSILGHKKEQGIVNFQSKEAIAKKVLHNLYL